MSSLAAFCSLVLEGRVPFFGASLTMLDKKSGNVCPIAVGYFETISSQDCSILCN